MGNVADAPGWVKGQAPRLAVEYADSGQDEAELADRLRHWLGRAAVAEHLSQVFG